MSSDSHVPVPTSTLRATIHLGASSISMRISNEFANGKSEQLDFLEQSAPIAHDVFSQGRLTRSTIERCVTILTGFRQSCDELGVALKMRVVGTNILSEANNKEIFLNRIHISCGLEVEILDDGEMTRLIYLKTRRRLSDTPAMQSLNTLVLHVGPGNTRAILLQKGRITSYCSFRLGVHRTGEFLSNNDSKNEYRKNVRSQIKGPLDSLCEEFKDVKIEHIVLIGYEIQLLSSFIQLYKDKSFSTKALTELCDSVALKDEDALVRDYRVDYQTAAAIQPALEINLAIAEAFAPKRLHIPSSDYEQGLLYDLNHTPSLTGEFTKEVVRSAEKIAKKYKVHLPHARQVAQLSLQLFEQLQELHQLTKHDALLLHIAALLHECGGFISNTAHHKHSQYIILNSEIFGLPHADIEMVALIARYHRNSLPKPTHSYYKDLNVQNRMRVSKLAALLRIADALDRSHTSRIQNITSRISRRRLHLYLPQITDAHSERLAMKSKGNLFENIFGLNINLVEDSSN